MEDRKLCMHCMARKADEQEACPVCGFIERDFVPEKHHLPPRTILKGQYLVGCALGEGGFGITYIGWDLFLHIPVAIKEYFPSGVVIRDQGQCTVSVFAGKDEQSFLKGRESFFREAQKVARFDNNPGVVSVKNCFIENGTAYIIMEYISGINLGVYASKRGGKLGFEETLRLLETPIRTLNALHGASTYHRDISPENLMLSKTGTVKLIDFGSAMESDSEKKTRVLMVRSGYSPVEMYSTNGKDGSYSDVYSMAATIYKLITGVTPPAATERLDADPLVRPTMLGVKDITTTQENALMRGLTVQQKDRYQTIASLHGQQRILIDLALSNVRHSGIAILHCTSNLSFFEPISSLSPGFTLASRLLSSLLPFSHVPLDEPRSRTIIRPFWINSSQCVRLTLEEVSVSMPAPCSLPTRSGLPAGMETTRPAHVPSSPSSLPVTIASFFSGARFQLPTRSA